MLALLAMGVEVARMERGEDAELPVLDQNWGHGFRRRHGLTRLRAITSDRPEVTADQLEQDNDQDFP